MSSSGLEAASGQGSRYLAFTLRDERYAIPLLTVREVIAMPEFTPVPHTPAHFLGIMNLRGQVISVVDLRTKFSIKPLNPKGEETAVVICDLGGISLGIVVCSVDSVLTLTPEQIQPKPQIQSHASTDYITGVTKQGDDLVLLLNVAAAIDVADQAALKKSQARAA